MKKFFKAISKIFLALLIIIGVVVISNPLRWTDNLIRYRLLLATPVNSSVDDVKKYIKHSNWDTCDLSNSSKKSYYGCDFISYREMCDFKKGTVEIKKNIPYCISLNTVVLIDMRKICSELGGNWTSINESRNECIANRSINAFLGEYTMIPPLPLVTTVTASWEFDNQKKLITISVSKSVDGT